MTSSVVWAGKKMGGKKWIILLPMIPPFYQPLREIPRQDRQKNGGRRIGDAGVPPSSLIRFTHPPGFASLSLFASLRSPFGQPPAGYLRYATVRFARLILHHSSFIIHPSPPSPTITLGPYKGDQLSVDHIIPFSVAPQLDHVIANLELMPLRLNMGKKDRMTDRQHALAARLRRAGLF
jgi:hypothetical protein